MLLQIEQQEEEIMNKISALKAVKEEMDKQEVNIFISVKKIYIYIFHLTSSKLFFNLN